MRSIKYIMLDWDTPILFPDHMNHSDVAANFSSPVTSAGFVSVNGRDEYGDTLVQCYGESVSLKIKSNEKDSKIMNRTFGLL